MRTAPGVVLAPALAGTRRGDGSGSGGSVGTGEWGGRRRPQPQPQPRAREQAQAQTQDELRVSITETNAPLPAGEYLRVTTALENTGTDAIRTEASLLVGDDETRVSRRRLTIEAGRTRTIRQGFYTHPVPRNDEFTIRVAAGGQSSDRRVGVAAASSVPAARPTGELAVQPGAAVLFEAEAIDPNASQRTVWWVDGELIGGGVGGPWASTYYAERGAHYRWHEFESSGTHDVTAAVLPGTAPIAEPSRETYAARWRVDVTDGGAAPPTVEGVRPREQVVPISPATSTEFELLATDPDGSLDSVVWWLTQSDVILDVTELEGTRDTATISLSSGCHTCTVLPWVICTDGTVTALESRWELDARSGGDDGADGSGADGIAVSIQETNSPVDAGEFLAVTATARNGGSETRTTIVELVVGHDPTVVERRSVTLAGGERRELHLGYETYPTARNEQFPVRVVSDADAAETTVRVLA
ncbi:hypothetical protein C481_03762 [Natrialba asiatica DSM 12278]|uniref:CARDB domain-containing protein n=1 Tax=Natrialba asiatica (strain ATCC 700177 / DSM 12278 / JCM 9576 / FERM P-10747 / NBRC 102637 / 172P1) TaxID=29540 RepID=M0B255_NATA1|nr:hypothetical protein C481_03762 [Natrialba asiatica DSM 12278]